MADTDKLHIRLKDFQGEESDNIKLTQLFVSHIKSDAQTAQELTDRLIAGEDIKITIDRNSMNVFYQGLEQFKLDYQLEEQ